MIRRVAILVTVMVFAQAPELFSQPGRIPVRDSAGVRIAELPAVTTIQTQFVVSDAPLYRVGWDESGQTFEDIVAGGLWPDGRAVVGDGRSALQVVLLSPSGAVGGILGKPGDGPGEFRSIFATLPLAGDTIVVQDPNAQRATIFARGKVVRTVRLDSASVIRLLGTDAVGRFLFGPPQSVVYGRRYETPWLSVPLVRLNPQTRALETTGRVDWDQSIAGSGGSDNPFMSGGFATVADGRFVVGRGDRPELRWYDAEGKVRQITRWHDQPRAVPDQMIAAWERTTRAAFARVRLTQADIDRRISTMKSRIQEPLPFFGNSGPTPSYGGLIGDSEGNVWVAEFASRGAVGPRRYYVMSPQGEWLGRADIPNGFRILAIGSDRVLGVERNSLDVQAVSVYTFRKSRLR